MHIKIKLIKGAIIALITSALANIITFGNIELTNVIVGGIIGSIVYLILHK